MSGTSFTMETPFAGDSTLTYCANACRELFHRCLSNNLLCAYQRGWPENQLARFDIWGDNLGLYRQGHASADYRLRNHNEARRLLLQLLGTLHEKLSYIHQNAIEEVTGGDIAAVSPEDNSPHLSTVSFVLSSTSSSSLDDDQSLPVGVKDACSEVKDTINRLNKLTLSIRRPYMWNQPTEADRYVVKDGDGRNLTEFYTRISTSIICRTFPDAHKTLQLRLINSLIARYNRLSYYRKQRKPTPEEGRSDSHSFPRANLSRMSSQAPETLNKLALANTESIDLSAHPKLEDMEFPLEPGVEVEGFFTCPYCFIPCPTEEARGGSWRNHVMEDIGAYVCLFPDCTKPDQFFQTVGDWISHIQDEHTSVCWDCLSPSHDPFTFEQEEKFIDHVKQSHQNAFTDSQLPGIAAMSARHSYNIFQSCPLCDSGRSTTLDGEPARHQDDLQRHVINHLQSLALLSLYWLDNPNKYQNRVSSQSVVTMSGNEAEKTDTIHDNTGQVDGAKISSISRISGFSLGSSMEPEMDDLRHPTPQNNNILPSWNENLKPDYFGTIPGTTLVSTQSSSQASHSSVVEDLGNSYTLVDNQKADQAWSSRLSRAELLSYEDDFSTNLWNISKENSLTTKSKQEDLGRSIRAALQTSQSRGKQEFLPNDALDKIITLESVRHQLNRHSVCPKEELDQLTSEIWNITSSHPPSKAKFSKARPRKTTRRKIFAILSLMNKFKAIVDFIHAGLYDNDLPFKLSQGPLPGLKQLTCKGKDGKEHIEFFENWETFELEYFNSMQWRFTAPYFQWSSGNTRRPHHYLLHTDTILPFIQDEEIGEARAEGGYADVWRIKIHPAHHSGYDDTKTPLERNPSYAIKRLRHNNPIAFNNEASNLKRFSGKVHEHLIKLLATFQWRDQFYLIFPWADGNLLDFWKVHPEPPDATKDPKMARWLSEQCLGLVDGLKSIHNGDNQKSKSGNYIHGRHGDLKPENILWFKDRTDERSFGTLKISDFGLARFHRTRSNTMFKAVAISRTYRPPEYDIAHMVSQSFDIWTLGCVLLEFVTWYLLGWEEVESFSKERVAEDRREFREDVFFHSVQIVADDGVPTLGAKAKQSVADEFQKLYEHERCSDFIVDLLAYIEKSLLRIGPRKRANCDNIFQQFTNIHKECLEDQRYCIDRIQAPSKRSGTALSEVSASTLNLSPELQEKLHEKIHKSLIYQNTDPLAADYRLSENPSSLPAALQENISERDDRIHLATPKPLTSIRRTLYTDCSSDGIQDSRPPSHKRVHFDRNQGPLVKDEEPDLKYDKYEDMSSFHGESIALNNIEPYRSSSWEITQPEITVSHLDRLRPPENRPDKSSTHSQEGSEVVAKSGEPTYYPPKNGTPADPDSADNNNLPARPQPMRKLKRLFSRLSCFGNHS